MIGAAGFVGSAIAAELEKTGNEVVRTTRSDVNLANADASARLSRIVSEGDTVVFAAADAEPLVFFVNSSCIAAKFFELIAALLRGMFNFFNASKFPL